MERRKFVQTSLIAASVLFSPSWLKAAFKKDLPKVLILGDSISIGYTPFVKKIIADKAYVYRPLNEKEGNENCQGTINGVKHIDRWIGKTKWDVIHFNFGLHDLKRVDPTTGGNSKNPKDPLQSNLSQYKKNISEIVKKLKKTNAKLIFATTTPYPDSLTGAIRDPGLSKKYNRVAIKVMKRNKIIINDLYSFILPRMKELQLPNNVHFNTKGKKALGKRVADIISTQLKKIKQ